MDRTKALFTLVAVVLLGSCSHQRKIVVGSKNFSEQLILGEIVAQHLEQALQTHVQRKLDLGGTLLAHQALVKGEIDLYPEYTGTALTTILKQEPDRDPAAVLEKVRSGYKQWNLQWAAPLGFDNTFAMTVRKEDAEERGVHTLTEAAQFAPGWKLGVGYEFLKRPDGLAGLIRTYRLNAKGSVKPWISDFSTKPWNSIKWIWWLATARMECFPLNLLWCWMMTSIIFRPTKLP